MKEKVSSHPVYLRLKEALNASTDTQLAKMLKVTKQSVNGWKKNGKVKRSRLESVAKLTGVSLGWLLTGEAEKYPTQKQPKLELTRSIGREEYARSVTVSVSPLPFRSLPVAAELVNNQLVEIHGARSMDIPESIGSEVSVAAQEPQKYVASGREFAGVTAPGSLTPRRSQKKCRASLPGVATRSGSPWNYDFPCLGVLRHAF